MIYYRCKCGYREAWGLYALGARSVEASSPESHQEPHPHEFEPTSVETDEGTKSLSRCRWCHWTKKQIEKKESFDAAQALTEAAKEVRPMIERETKPTGLSEPFENKLLRDTKEGKSS